MMSPNGLGPYTIVPFGGGRINLYATPRGWAEPYPITRNNDTGSPRREAREFSQTLGSHVRPIPVEIAGKPPSHWSGGPAVNPNRQLRPSLYRGACISPILFPSPCPY